METEQKHTNTMMITAKVTSNVLNLSAFVSTIDQVIPSNLQK